MTVSRLSFVTLVLSFMLTVACTARSLEKEYLGKNLTNLNLISKPLAQTESGYHFWSLEHLDIDYDYFIDRTAKTITLDGKIKYTLGKYETGFGSESVLLNIDRCEFRVLFADIDTKVVAVEVFNIYPRSNLFEPAPFKETLPYDNSYRFMVLGYYLYASGR